MLSNFRHSKLKLRLNPCVSGASKAPYHFKFNLFRLHEGFMQSHIECTETRLPPTEKGLRAKGSQVFWRRERKLTPMLKVILQKAEVLFK